MLLLDGHQVSGLAVDREGAGDIRSWYSFISCTNNGEGGFTDAVEDHGASVKSVRMRSLALTMDSRVVVMDGTDTVEEPEDNDIDEDIFQSPLTRSGGGGRMATMDGGGGGR